MTVYANLLGNWTMLTEEDSIDGIAPINFIEHVLLDEDGFESFKQNNEFVEIAINNDAYRIHKSQIQYIYNK